jgi:CPA1 family monovalent cation:H+ antiporter
MSEAVGHFFLVAGMGIVAGLLGGLFFYSIHRFLPTVPTMDAALTVITPYVVYLMAEHFHVSGVMAVVTCGLFMSWRAHEVFDNGQTRMYLFGVWNTVIFVMNTVVFVIIGLELPEVMNDLGSYSIADGIYFGLLVSGIIIALRFLWVYPAAYIPRWFSKSARRVPGPGWRGLLLLSWSGMRGVVSLATALSIPILGDFDNFEQRNLVIFIAYIVIFVTLVFQGLSLPLIIRLLQIKEIDDIQSEEQQQVGIQLRLDRVASNVLNREFSDELEANQLLECWRASLENDIETKQRRLEALDCDESERNNVSTYHRILMTTYAMQRRELFQIKRERLFSEEEIRKAEMQIDIDELRITGIGK